MFSRADDECLQFIRKEQCRFQKGGQEEDESLGDEAELHPKNIYLLALHTYSYRWSYKKTMDALAICYWNYPKPIQEHTTIDAQGYINYQRQENNEPEQKIVDEIKDYLNARYLSAMEAVWHIFKYKITSHYAENITNQYTLPSNTYLEEECIGCCQREKYYLCMLLNYHPAQSFEDLRKVNRILYPTFQDAVCALGLLDNTINMSKGMAAQTTWQNYHELLSEDYINRINNLQQGVNESLVWIATFLEEHGYDIKQCGLPQPHSCLSEIIRIKQQYRRTATILKSIKLSHIWNTFKVYKLQKPVRDANDPIYSKFMDNIGNSTTGENVTLTLINTTDELNDIINFTFPTHVLNNPTTCDETNLYSVNNLADDESNNILENQKYQRNMVTTELLNSFNAPGVPRHCLILKHGCVATIMRNLSLRDKLCKNSRVIVTNIEYSSTFNSSQGLTLDKVALDLRTP
ncbi:13647_t:CDS:2, partial [Gigaspora margarita]